MKHVVGITVALPQEAYALFGRLGWSRQEGFPVKAERFKNLLAVVAISGQGRERACKAAEFLLRSNPLFMLNLGVAGALVEELSTGDLFTPSLLTDGKSKAGVDSDAYKSVSQLLRTQGFKLHDGLLVTCDRTIDSPAAKAELYQKTGAYAVDMEAFGIAQACSGFGVPIYIVKAVTDSLHQTIPRAITSCLTETGQISLVRFTVTILSRPWLVPKLLEMQKSFKSAVFSLEQVKSVLSANLSRNITSSC